VPCGRCTRVGLMLASNAGSQTMLDTLFEKLKIATEHLIAKQIGNHGLTADHVVFEDAAIRNVIRGYTREAGVRNLEREIGALCRKVARRRAEGDETRVVINPDAVVDMLTGGASFKDGFLEIWSSLKDGVRQILSDILNQFINSFLKGMLGAMAGSQGAFSSAFAGKRSLQRHQLVYATLGPRVGTEIHALALKTFTPEEWAERGE